MSGGPPHHPHNRQVPAANTAWNHLQVPNYFPRQPQLAHMSNEHSLLHQPTWHTPTTTEAMKIHPHTHMLSEMLKNDPLFPRDCVDLSLTRNGNQNGELPTTPISLSVRDTNKINSLPASVLDIQAVELTKCTSPIKSASPVLKSVSPGLKSVSPGLKSVSPGPKSVSPSLSTQVLPTATSIEVTKTQKRSNIRVDSILERLNPMPEKIVNVQENKIEQSMEKSVIEKPVNSEKAEKQPVDKSVSVIVQPASSYDENSNSSSILNIPTSTNIREEDTVSTYSNEDSLDSNKSRRKRKPSKTIRVSKDEDKACRATPPPEQVEGVSKESKSEPDLDKDSVTIVGKMLEENKVPERRRSSDDLDVIIPAKTRRKTSSESETIDNIAAMVQEGLKAKKKNNLDTQATEDKLEPPTKPISVSVIKTKDNLNEALSDSLSNSSTNLVTPAQKKATNPHFVEVENKLEEMFAGIEDSSDPLKTDNLDLDDSKLDDGLLKLDDPLPSTSQETVTVTSTTEVKKKTSAKKKRKAQSSSRRSSDANSLESTPKKKSSKKIKGSAKTKTKTKTKKAFTQKQPSSKADSVKDVYAYDSGSNASSNKSRGPFIQIRGPRDSPLSVSVVNTPITDDDGEKKVNKSKKFHDDTEYRHKVRSKGLHCSTLSNKYDAQTKDTTWICTFCKRGPHASELTGPSSNGHIIPPGDLFGPYFITTQCPEFERRLDDPYDKQFKSKKITKVLEEPVLVVKGSGKKSKRKYSETDHGVDCDQSDIYLGITETNNKTYEIWAHEDCIVWSPGIYLVGPKIIGLEEAVWTSCNVSCKLCNLKGANICCLKRGCLNVMHLCCARSNNWQFLESNYKAYCPQHTVP